MVAEPAKIPPAPGPVVAVATFPLIVQFTIVEEAGRSVSSEIPPPRSALFPLIRQFLIVREDNPSVMGPAGRVHCTIQDWAKFIADQLRGARGEPALLQSATYKALHTSPCGGDYALGWIVTQRDWGGGTVLNHGGSNTMNFANVWMAPRRDFAVLICVNQGGDVAFKASDEAVAALIGLHAKSM